MSESSPQAGIPRSFLAVFLRFALGALFLFSSWQKLKPPHQLDPAGPQSFALSVKAFDILPDSIIPFAASSIAWTEVICALFLIIGLWTRAATTVLLLAMFTFTIAVISVIMRNLPIHCGCFGKLKLFCEGPVSWCKVGENSAIIIALFALLIVGAGRFAFNGCCKPRPVLPQT